MGPDHLQPQQAHLGRKGRLELQDFEARVADGVVGLSDDPVQSLSDPVQQLAQPYLHVTLDVAPRPERDPCGLL